MPPRFRTKEDATLFMECLRNKKDFPDEKWVYPFKRLPNGDCITSPEYKSAQFEVKVEVENAPNVV